MRVRKKEPLYRKVNTKTWGVHHHSDGAFRDTRKSKKQGRLRMSQGVKRGLDYTPLFRFLLSSVGKKWDKVHSEAVSRLDHEEPIYGMVSLTEEEATDYAGVGESSYFSGLYVDTAGYLQITSPELTPETFEPFCGCCTHTFNGTLISKKYHY